MNKDWGKLKAKLESEKKQLIKDLSAIGVVNPDRTDDWNAVPSSTGEINSRDETAERMEELGERKAIEISLEKRVQEINQALDKMANGTYGICEVGGEEIELERLEANPAAKTCIKHLED